MRWMLQQNVYLTIAGQHCAGARYQHTIQKLLTDLFHEAARVLLAGQLRRSLQGCPQLQCARQRQAFARLLQQHRYGSRRQT